MEKASSIHWSLVDLFRWVITFTIALIVIAPYLYKGQKRMKPVFEEAIVSAQTTISDNYRPREGKPRQLDRSLYPTPFLDGRIGYLEEEIHPNASVVASIQSVETGANLDMGLMPDELLEASKVSRALGMDLATSTPSWQDTRNLHCVEELDVLIAATGDAPVLEPYCAVQVETEQASAGLDQDKTKDPIKSKPGISSAAISRKEAEQLCDSIIRKAAKRYQVDPALIRAIIMAESSYNPKAVSKKGAIGLMQLMPRTAEALGVEDSFNPEHNINAGVKYFKQLLNQFNGDVKLALAAYNAGSRKVREYKGIPPFKATQHYIKKVFEYRKGYQK